MPQLDASLYIPQLFWLGVVFCLLYAGMRFLIEPRMERLLKRRRRKLQEKLKEIEQFKIETEELRLQSSLFVAKKQKEMEELLLKASQESIKRLRKFEEDFHHESLKKMGNFETALQKEAKELTAHLKSQESALAKLIMDKVMASVPSSLPSEKSAKKAKAK
jgi:F0F1-type ATP synthase membrane subunit b/b'